MISEELENKIIEEILTGEFNYIRYTYGEEKIVISQNKDQFREYFLHSPHEAFWYAYYIDKIPNDRTREVSSQNPSKAFHYAYLIDKGPHEVTRKGASKNPSSAYQYATNIDKQLKT